MQKERRDEAMDNSNPRSLLAIEERNNSFLPININDLDLDFSFVDLTLIDIDTFTRFYDEVEIKNAIKIANIVPVEALNGKLVILYEKNGQKIKLPIIKKEFYENYNLEELLINNKSDKELINRLISKIKTLRIADESKDSLENALRSVNIKLFFDVFYTLDYLLQRNLYLYVIEGFNNKKVNVRIREKKEVE